MRLVALALLVAGAAPVAADDELDVPGLYGELRGDAFAWEDATFYLEPWEGGLSVRFGTLRSRREDVGRVIPIRIVSSSMRSFVEVEFPGRASCSWRRVGNDPRVEALRIYVKRDDLAPVLVKPFAAAYNDGTSVKLGIGVPVMPTASGLYTVGLRTGEKLHLPIPHASVGYVYTPGRIVEPAPPAKAVRINFGSVIRIDNEPIEVRGPWYAPAPTSQADNVHVTVWGRCLELVVSAPASALRADIRPPASTASIPLLTPPFNHTHYIPRGAPLSTAGGIEAAVAGDAIGIAAPVGNTACFDARLTMVRLDDAYGSVARTFKLCAAAGIVEPEPTQALHSP